MQPIVLNVRLSVKDQLRHNLRRCRDADVRQRYLIVFNVLNGRSARQTEEALQVHNTTVYRVLRRFRAYGEAGLCDGRADNGADKLTETYLGKLDRLVRASPQDYGWRRPTWTRELLVQTMVRLTGVRIHVATMSRALAKIKARRGRPKPTVGCPWPKAAKTRRLNRIRALLAALPRRQRAFYEDEVDVHLNPKIGLDWMGQGQQKEAQTPGQNDKRYLAGALDVRTGLLTWVEGARKTSYLFLGLLDKLLRTYPEATKLHLILDNYRIHSSAIVLASLKGYLAGRVELHFLPPYCPDHNRIERVWQDLHANVTRESYLPHDGQPDAKGSLLPPQAQPEETTSGSSLTHLLPIRARSFRRVALSNPDLTSHTFRGGRLAGCGLPSRAPAEAGGSKGPPAAAPCRSQP